ncbi:MAG: hypothetical protein QW203_07345 [Thermoplasmatales archaeon]
MEKIESSVRKILDSATQALVDESNETGVFVVGNSTTSASGNTSLINIPSSGTGIAVSPGTMLVVSELDFFANVAATFQVSYSYTVGNTTIAGNKLYYLESAGMISDVQSLRVPIITLLNTSNSTVSFLVQVLNATSGNLYGANIRYAIR